MPVYEKRSPMPVPASELFAWHARAGALQRLLPPWEDIRVLEHSGGIRDGARLTMEISMGLTAVRWIAEHHGYVEGSEFRDDQIEGPFAKWQHTHRCLPQGEARSILSDEVDYELPLGSAGRLAGNGFTRTMLERMFHFRHERTRQDLNRHAAFAAHGKLTVAVTGASGLIGTALVAFLQGGGHTVRHVVRRKPSPGSSDIYWNPETGEASREGFEGVDAVVHLAGENIGAGRWTPERKEVIRKSRVDGTSLLAETLATLNRKPTTLIVASAIGYYGDRGDETLTESSAAGHGYLAEVCKGWEAASGRAAEAGIRVVNARIGVVIASKGGALPKLLTPFKLGLGGPVGNGRQYMSWVAHDDVIGALHFLLMRDDLAGAVNLVAPQPLSNKEFSKVLGKVLGRPSVLPLPGFAVKAALGEMGQELLLP